MKDLYNSLKKELNDSDYGRVNRQKRFLDDEMDKFTKNKSPFINKSKDLSEVKYLCDGLRDLL